MNAIFWPYTVQIAMGASGRDINIGQSRQTKEQTAPPIAAPDVKHEHTADIGVIFALVGFIVIMKELTIDSSSLVIYMYKFLKTSDGEYLSIDV